MRRFSVVVTAALMVLGAVTLAPSASANTVAVPKTVSVNKYRGGVAANGGVKITASVETLNGPGNVVLDVRGTPIPGLWHVSVLSPERRTAPADALRRFVTLPEATRAILSRARGVPDERSRPAIQTRRER